MVSNERKEQVWRAYRAGRPTRVPVTYGVNPRVVLLEERWNRRGVTFQEYWHDAAATVEVQLAFLDFQRAYLHHYCDSSLGDPPEWLFYVDTQNTYDSLYFGAPLAFRDGQVADVECVYAGAGKERIFEVDIDRPLDNPFVRELLARHERLTAAARTVSRRGIRFGVAPPLVGFDGPLTVAVNLRGPDFLADLVADPPYAQRVLAFIQEGAAKRNIALAERFGRRAFDGPRGSLADDSIALISPAMYRQKLLPLHAAWYARWSVAGPHSIHLCGDATRHFAALARHCHVESFDTGFPVDHGAMRAELGEGVELLGGPEVGLLLGGSPQAVYERTRNILRSGVMRGGRFILREANNLPPKVPEANLAAMYRCCLEHGRYADDGAPPLA